MYSRVSKNLTRHMTKQIVITLKETANPVQPNSDMVHRLRNFGEDLFREFAANGQAEISLDEVDSAVSELRVFVKGKSKLGVVFSSIKRMLQDHKLDDQFIVIRDQQGKPPADQ